jgi:hypothetical protein
MAENADSSKVSADMFEEREFSNGDTYKVLVIDSPDKWSCADDLKFTDVIQRGSQNVRINLQCIPFSTNVYVNDFYPIPNESDFVNKSEYVIESEKIKLIRKAIFIETALGISLKGSSIEEKASSLSLFPANYIDRLSDIISNKAASLHDGVLAQAYKKSEESGAKIKDIKNEDIFDFSECPFVHFRTARPFEDYLIEFPLKQLTTEDRSRIESDNVIPDPPNRPGRGFDTKNSVPWPEEPGYKARIGKMAIKKTIDFLQACLPFEIPGNNVHEKHNWIGKRPAGDVLKLKLFIQMELVDYSWAVNFF